MGSLERFKIEYEELIDLRLYAGEAGRKGLFGPKEFFRLMEPVEETKKEEKEASVHS